MENDLVCQFNFGHKIWGAVDVCRRTLIVFITVRSPAFSSRLTICGVQEEAEFTAKAGMVTSKPKDGKYLLPANSL
jgi:hypothetical protein